MFSYSIFSLIHNTDDEKENQNDNVSTFLHNLATSETGHFQGTYNGGLNQHVHSLLIL